MLEYMKKYPTMATNSPAESSLGRQSSQKLWEELCQILNSNGPPVKNIKAWKKTWADYKHRAKTKLAKNKNSLQKTGGGPYKEVQLTPFEEAVAELAKIKAAVLGITDAKSFGGEIAVRNSSTKPSTSKEPMNIEDEVEQLLKNVLSESESDTSDDSVEVENDVPIVPEPKKNTKTTQKASSSGCSDRLELFKNSASSSEEFQQKLIGVLIEIRDLKQDQINILKKQAADNLNLQIQKLNLREQEIQIALRRNELEELKLGSKTNS
ncbi:uncharacterized protein LOC129912860 [Episyrphus balteatus]|nr:uncharacterized protein LOC129905272 [Episyrphus balteatus]XP_055847223.1 uncharacterized protein LOC129912844 [Episyrphus balteatus]XP_055847224.1 uncharacterized protein LOC129912860 [Episyrphus balteatus]